MSLNGMSGWKNSATLKISTLQDLAQQVAQQIEYYSNMAMNIGDQKSKMSDSLQLSMYQGGQNNQQMNPQNMQRMQANARKLSFMEQILKSKERRLTTKKNQIETQVKIAQTELENAKKFEDTDIKQMKYA